MEFSPKTNFKDLKSQISNAIKESCYVTDARLFNIANQVHDIQTSNVEPGVDNALGLSKIIDKTIKESLALDCDLSVIVKGILLGAFRAGPSMPSEARNTICILIAQIFQAIFKYKGDLKKVVEGLLSAILIITNEYQLNEHETLIVAKKDILFSAKALGPKFADEIEAIFSELDDL